MKKSKLLSLLACSLLCTPLTSCVGGDSSTVSSSTSTGGETSSSTSSSTSSTSSSSSSSSSTSSTTPEIDKLTKMSFKVTLAKSIDSRYSVGVLVSDDDYSTIHPLTVGSDRKTATGDYVNEAGIVDAGTVSYKFAIIDTKSSALISEEYVSVEYSTEVTEGTKEVSVEHTLTDMALPSSGLTSYFIASIYDSDANNEDITLSSLKYLSYTDAAGIVKNPSDFAIGETVYVRYTSPVLMDGRQVIDKAAIKINDFTSTELKFEASGDEKSPVYTATFVKKEKDARLHIYLGSEFLLGVDASSASYVAGVSYNTGVKDEETGDYVYEDLDVASLVENPVYLRKNTEFKVTLGDIGVKSAKIVGTKLNAPDSYAYESEVLFSNQYFTTNLTGNNQDVTVLVSDPVSVNINRSSFVKKTVTYNWTKSDYVKPDMMFDGKYEKGFDNWGSGGYFDELGPRTVEIKYENPHTMPLDRAEIHWYVVDGDAIMPTTLNFYYQLAGSDEWIQVAADKVVTDGDYVTTVSFNNEENPNGLANVVGVKLEYNGGAGSWSNIEEFEVYTVGSVQQ